MAYKITKEEFQNIAETALASIPSEFRERLKNISIVVEEQPTREDASSVGASRRDLLGLFVGGGYAAKDGVFTSSPLPDRVVLYQKNLQRYCSSREELEEEIRATLFHEIGHYFGLSEEELEELE